jgi:two-component system CheB/CheR fusion protein
MSVTDEPSPEPASVQQLVVVGASAGGIDALSAVLAALPAEFPAPIVIAQHLDPARASHLGEILAARTALPVRTVRGRSGSALALPTWCPPATTWR